MSSQSSTRLPLLAALLLFLVSLLSRGVPCRAHNTAMERQLYIKLDNGTRYYIRNRPWRNSRGDSSFAHPMALDWGVQTSQAIFGYLGTRDVDVFSFSLNDGAGSASREGVNDFQQARDFFNSSTPLAVVAALPPACWETLHHYPAVALVAPLSSRSRVPLKSAEELDLPFALPEGYGAFPAYDRPPAAGGRRLVFAQPDEPGETPFNIAWFLPNGCTYAGPGQNGLDCANSTTLYAPVAEAGVTYYIAVWDPEGRPQDYTMNIGLDERFTVDNFKVEDAVKDNNYLHTECSPPYEAEE